MTLDKPHGLGKPTTDGDFWIGYGTCVRAGHSSRGHKLSAFRLLVSRILLAFFSYQPNCLSHNKNQA